MTIAPGLCSITFRSLTADEVLQARACVRASRGSSGAPTVTSLRAEVPAVERAARRGAATRAWRSCRTAPISGSHPPTATRPARSTPCSTPHRRSARRWCGSGPSSAWAPRRPPTTADRVTDRTARFVDAIASRGLDRRARVPPVHPHGDGRFGQRVAHHARPTEPQDALATRPARCPPRPRWPSSRRSRRISRTCTPSPGARPASTIAARSPTAPTSGRRRSNSPIETVLAARPPVRALRVRPRRRPRAARRRRRRAPSLAGRAPRHETCRCTVTGLARIRSANVRNTLRPARRVNKQALRTDPPAACTEPETGGLG